MTRRERLESKVEKREQWAASRRAKADMEYEKADLSEEKTGIPFGQPILVGHHSEGRHRRMIDRAHRAMDRCAENNQMAKEHEHKAEGLRSQLANTIFSDDENAVEALEAKIEKLEKEREFNSSINKIVRKKPRNESTPEKLAELAALGVKESTAKLLFEPDYSGRCGIPAYVNQNLGGRIKAARDRLAIVKQWQENQAAASENESGILVKYNNRGWCFVTFAEKPEREILTAMKAAGFNWSSGSWAGSKDKLPECVRELAGIEEAHS